ncbi:endonuclease [uncultured Dokdonia sp.]|uniref:endonuclease/exonuclease/phosphatase family protein n=1 Tax=uncultured Dokdonia sp. TaxID=575653 RepID=UPI002615AE43|nr:endonuclease [uncultured Dokdonia sp.]
MKDNSAFAKAHSEQKKIGVAFYNLENLFDTQDDPETLDDDFTAEGYKNWNSKRYTKKLNKLGRVISQIGHKETNNAPSLVGVAEVENKAVLQKLIETEDLEDHGYDIVHYDSPDERGIDVGLLYLKEDFKVIDSETVSVYLESEFGERDYTRDILHVTGNLMGVRTHVLVNHWPSRRSGVEESQPKRITAAQKNRMIIERIEEEEPEARIIVMGDFNDGPHNESIKNHLVQKDLYNPMVFLNTRYEGSLNHDFEWYLFDQIILSANFMRMHKNTLRYDKSDIYNEHHLTEFKGRFKGNPFRTYAGRRYLGGYSDHFPVYCIFKHTP